MPGAVHAVIGTDEGRVSEEAMALFNDLKPEGEAAEFTNDVIEGVVANSEEAYQACIRTIEGLQTIGFFGADKIVWLKGANFLADDQTGGAERAKQGVEDLLDVLKAGTGDEVTFLVSASAIDKRRGFYKWLQKNGEVAAFDKIDVSKDRWEEEVALMVTTRAKKLGLAFDHEALDLFVQMAGEETRQIGNELEKLNLYQGDRRTVELEDVRLMVPLSRKGVVFEISRAIERRDTVRAIELVDAQLEKGESAIGLMRAAIIPTVRNLFMVRILLDAHPKLPLHNGGAFTGALNRLPDGDKAWLPQTKSGSINAWGLFFAAKKAGQFTTAEMRHALEAALNADKSLVTTQLDHRMVLHRLVAELTMTGKKKQKKSA
ncbi:MAG: DNA polymerase III subunit delta [Roseibacillus sp.]|nr:DNA polymerase III subunit delta [Roseibacillus sp.]